MSYARLQRVMRPKARLGCAKMPVVCTVVVVYTVAYTPNSRFRSLLPWKLHLMSIPRKWSTGLDEGDNKLQTTEDTNKPFGISLTTEWTGYSQITHTLSLQTLTNETTGYEPQIITSGVLQRIQSKLTDRDKGRDWLRMTYWP